MFLNVGDHLKVVFLMMRQPYSTVLWQTYGAHPDVGDQFEEIQKAKDDLEIG